MNIVAPMVPTDVEPVYYSVADIARAVKRDKETVRDIALREGWPLRRAGNRQEFSPPDEIARIIIAAPASEQRDASLTAKITVRFEDIHDAGQREKIMLREKAVLELRANLPCGKEVALETVSAAMRVQYPDFSCSARSLRRWDEAYTADGLDGLVEQKLGNVGCKAFADDLDEQTILRGKAAAIEHGNARKGDGKPQLNIAKAFREMVADPTLRGPERRWLHGERASKSEVPPSVRRVLTSSMLATTLIQRGAKAAKLAGPFTECDYSNTKAGTTFTADDMTANVYVWCNWNNEDGFLLIRPQILAAMDVGSMSWLCLRAVMRTRGQYNHEDVWGLTGDVLDEYGKFSAVIFEGGTWQSKEVVGHRVSDEERFGGLRKLGIQVIHTRSPRGKIIEVGFNTLQHAADACIGFCGRNERVDCPEATKQALALVRAGKAHPSQYFMHISQYREHLVGVMNALNHERNDGKICQGRTPADVWNEENEKTPRVGFPDKSKWMYRATYSVTTVTSNGVLVKQGSGKYQVRYTFSHPALVAAQGRRVAVFWNDFDPDTDAVIYTINNGKPQELLCVAPSAQKLPRLGATSEQMRAESTRKAMIMSQATTERGSLAPYLQRNFRTVASRQENAAIDDQLKAAKAAGEKKAQDTARSSNNVSKFRAISKRRVVADTRACEDLSQETPSLQQTGENTFTYQLEPSGTEHAQYVDYLLHRLTEFRQAGASFGQNIGHVSVGITRKIAQSQLGCDLHDETRFDEVCGYLQAKIDATILGKRNAAKGTANYHEFAEHAMGGSPSE
jgi:hypothetical protein